MTTSPGGRRWIRSRPEWRAREAFGAATDYGPDGYAARAELIASTLAALGVAAVTADADRLAAASCASALRRSWTGTGGEPLRRTPHADRAALASGTASTCCRAAATGLARHRGRLAAIPAMFASWREPGRGTAAGACPRAPAGARAAAAADRYAGTHDTLVASYGDGPLAGELAAARRGPHGGYAELARYLREEYAPRAAIVDGAGAERYAVAARLALGADLDAPEAYEWGWAELARIEAELADEADKSSRARAWRRPRRSWTS